MKISRYILLIFIFITIKLSAQVIPSDSMALVDLYTSTNGNAWKNKTNWLTQKVSDWNGITVNSNRVTIINLSANNLSGPLPPSFCNLTKLEYLYVSNNNLSGNLPICFDNLTSLNTIDFRTNKFTGAIPPNIINFPKLADLYLTNNNFDQLPDLSSLGDLSNVLIENNHFTFEDLEPILGINNAQLLYIPQDSINFQTDTIIVIKDTATLQTFSGGSNNSYQWTKNGIIISNDSHYQGTNTPFLTINKLTLADEAYYSCIVTNPILSNLTLYRNSIRITINDTRLPQTISTLPGPNNYCGDLPAKIIASTDSGLPLFYSIVSGNGILKTDSLIPFSPGNIKLRLYNDGDDTYKPIVKDSIILILSPANSSMEITKIIPEKTGGQLLLSVPYQDNVQFLWINPNVDSTFSNSYVKQFSDENDEGVYTIKVGKNKCDYFTESFTIEISSLRTLIVYELISPDGDGKNDTFFIQNIEKYQDNEVHIFNTWNQSVFKKNNYTNDWSGEELPAGTYYYTIKIPSLNKSLKGSLYLKK